MASTSGGGVRLDTGGLEITMIRQSMYLTLGLLAGLTLGCEKKESPPAAPPAASAEKAVNDAASQSAAAQKAAADKVAAEKATADKVAADKLAAAQKAAADKVAAEKATADKVAADKLAAAENAAAVQAADLKKAAETKITTADDAAVANAMTMIEQAKNYIQDNKLDLAEKTLEQLDKIKPSLPEAIQSQITSAHKALDLAKATDSVSGLKLPGQ